MRVAVLSVLAWAIAACAATERPAAPSLPANVYRLAPEEAAQLFQQCSREAPELAGQTFEPDAADIARLEAALAAVLTSNAGTPGIAPALRFASDPASYARQYAGYTADGRSMIYGNLVPARDFIDKAVLARQAMTVCDGGATFFGVEYDVERQAVVRVAFNGSLGGPMVAPIRP